MKKNINKIISLMLVFTFITLMPFSTLASEKLTSEQVIENIQEQFLPSPEEENYIVEEIFSEAEMDYIQAEEIDENQIQQYLSDIDIDQTNTNDKISFDDISIDKVNQSISTRMYNNYTPNTAAFISSSYYGVGINDLASANQHWYYFESAYKSKSAIYMPSVAGADYDVYLFELSDDGYLTQVASSENYGDEFIHYITKAGKFYFFCINPYTPANPVTTYTFTLYHTKNLDTYEINDTISTGYKYGNNPSTISGNLDNPFDRDWQAITIKESYTQHTVKLSNVPSGKTYTVAVYNSSGGLINAFHAPAGTSGLNMSLPIGTYNIVVYSYYEDWDNTKNYALSVTPVLPTPYQKHDINLKLDGYEQTMMSPTYQLTLPPNGTYRMNMTSSGGGRVVAVMQYIVNGTKHTLLEDWILNGETNVTYTAYQLGFQNGVTLAITFVYDQKPGDPSGARSFNGTIATYR